MRRSQSDVQVSLFEIVVQCVFVALADSCLYARIMPESLESLHTGHWHGILRSNLDVAAYEFHICDVLWVAILHVVLLHGALDALECVEQVAKDGDLPLFALSRGEALGVYQAHLLEDRRLSALSSTCANTISMLADNAYRDETSLSPSSSIFTSLADFFWSALNCFSMSAFFLASGLSCFEPPKHMIAM